MSRRVRILGVALVAVVAIRACLPLAIGEGIERVAERAVAGTVEVEDVDLGLLSGRIAIEGLRIDRHTTAGADPGPPIATLARVDVNVAPSELLRKRAHVEEISVEGAALRLERSDTGDLVLPLSEELREALAAPPETPPDPSADFLPLPLQLDVFRVADVHAVVHDPVEGVESAAFDLAGLEIDALRVEGRRASVARIALSEPALLLDRGLIAGPRAMFREPSSESGASTGPEAVEIAREAERTEEPDVGGAPARTQPVAELGEPPSPEEGAPAQAPPSPANALIAALSISNARFTWIDRTHAPVVREESKDFSMEAHDLALNERGLFNLEVRGQGLRGEPFELTGTQGEEGSLEFHLVANDFDLAPFGPYAAEIAGYHVERGRVSIDSDVRFAFPKIDSENGLVLDGLRVAGSGYAEKGLGMGANLAIALLSGPDGRIHLNIPVSIALDEEAAQFAIAELQTAVQQAMQRSLDGVGAVGDGGSGVRFDPLRSAPGLPGLQPGQEDRLAAIAELLGEKPSVGVVLRGIANDADRQALAEVRGVETSAVPAADLDALARQRAEQAATLLTGLGVSTQQLQIGDPAQGAAPGVAWQLALAE